MSVSSAERPVVKSGMFDSVWGKPVSVVIGWPIGGVVRVETKVSVDVYPGLEPNTINVYPGFEDDTVDVYSDSEANTETICCCYYGALYIIQVI